MKKILFFLLTVMIGLGSLTLSAQDNTLTVANGSETNSYIPLYGTYADAQQHNQIIYPASMLTDMVGQAITSITFYASSMPSWGSIGYSVSIGTTTTSSISSNLLTDPVELVYTGHVDFDNNNRLTFVFNDPFVYSGDNLLFDITTTPTSSWENAEFYGVSAANTPSIYQYTFGGSPQYFIPKTTFGYNTASDCPKPNELQISDITTTSATFSWHPRSSGTTYVAVDLLGADPENLNWTAVTDTFYTFNGLTPGNGHVAYVYTDCGSEISNNASILFYTACEAMNVYPYFEGFEDSWIDYNTFGQNNQAPLCWSVYNGGTTTSSSGTAYDYRWRPNVFTSHVYEGNHSAVCYTDYAGNPHNDWLISPLMNLPENMMVSFWAQRSSNSTTEPDEISIWISDADITLTAPAYDSLGLDTLPLPGFTQIFQTMIPQGPFNLYEIPLTGYSGNRYIAFVRRYMPNDGYYLCLDNVTVSEIPSCQRPFDQSTDSVGTDFAVLNWTSDANSYILYYKLANADSFTVVTDVILDADSQYVLNDLLPGSSYQWYVAAVCDDGSVIPASTMVDFSTDCVPLATLPYTVDFETNNIGADGDLPACWSKPGYYTYPYVYNYSYYSHSGSHCLYSCSTSPVYAILPELDEEIDISNLQLSFWATSYYGTDCLIEVGTMSDPTDVSTFTMIDSVPFNSGIYTEIIMDLSSYEGSDHQLALRITCGLYNTSYGSYSDNLYIDDLTLAEQATCPRPEDVTVTGMTPTSATLTWTSEEDAFTVYYKANGMSGYVAANDSPINDNTYTVEDLTPGTDYHFFVSAICSDGTEAPSLAISTSLPCIGLTTLPYFCGFEDNLVGDEGQQLPQCWSRGSADETYPYVNNYGSYQGNNVLYSYYANTAAMPPIDTTEVLFSDLQVSFYAKAYSDGQILKVGVMSDPYNTNTFVQVGNDIVLTSSYVLYEVPFTNYQGNGNMVAFYTPQYSDIYIDNVTLDHLPDCQRPTITNVVFTNTEATVNWTADENANAWQIVITNNYADPSTLTPEDVSDNTYLFEDLTPGTYYQVYVRTNCGDDYSDWSNVYSFTTLNSMPALVPYTCDFEDTLENASWSFVNGFLANKWYIDTAANNTTDGQYSLYVSADSGATVSYNTNGSTYVWAYRDILFSDAAEFNFSFDWRCLGESGYYSPYDYIQVFIGIPTNVTSGSYITIPSSLTELGTFAGDSTWNTATFTLDGTLYANTVQRLYFLWYNNYSDGSGYSGAIDNIVISEVECARPASIDMTYIGTTTATLTITPASESDGAWEVSLNDSVFTTLDAVVELSNLTPGTPYEIYVRTICDGGDTSVWSLPISFLSECLLINTVPQTWGFETDLIAGSENYPMPVCWNRINNPQSSYSEYPYADNYGNAHNGTYSLYYDASYSNCYAILPAIDTEELSIQDLQLSFYASQSGNNNNVSFVVGVMTDPTNASTFTEVQSFILPNTYPADPFVASFANYTGNGAYIAIKNQTNGNSYVSLYLDDVTLESIPSCPTPSGVTVTATDMTSATISWTENGDATSWNIKYTDGENETTVVATSNPFTLTGLTAATSYSVQVQANCGTGENSNWTGALTFNTALCPASDQCAYTFNLTDSYGDGWNNGYLDIQQNGISVATVSLSNGTSGTETVNLCDNTSTSLIWIPGSYADEVGFSLVDPNGTTLYTITGMYSYSTFTFTTSCTIPTCLKPTNITVSNIGATSAVVSWTPAGTETAWNLEYKVSTDSTWTVIPVTTTSYTLNNLTASTNYDVRVQADCGEGDVSDYTATSFSTSGCEISQQCQYTFVIGDDYGDGWNDGYLTVEQNGVTVATIEATDNYDEPSTETVYVMLCDNIVTSLVWHSGMYDDEVSITLLDPDGTQLFTISEEEEIPSALFTFTTDCGSGPVITDPTVATVAASAIEQTTATLNATITNPDNVTITAKGFEWKATAGGTYTSIAGTGTGNNFSANLSGLTANTGYTYKAFITFNGTTVYGSEMTFNTLPEDVQPCNVPTNLHTTDIQNEAISIAWDANASVNSWNVQYRPAAGGQWTQVTVNTNSYTITNLTGKTNYEIQVQANCGDGNLSDWSASITTQTTDVGIVNYLENSITLFPNPANDVVNVQCTMNNVQLESVEVIDVYGKVVRTVVGANNYSPMPIRINVSGLTNGMYFVRVATDEGVTTKTFIKK